MTVLTLGGLLGLLLAPVLATERVVSAITLPLGVGVPVAIALSLITVAVLFLLIPGPRERIDRTGPIGILAFGVLVLVVIVPLVRILTAPVVAAIVAAAIAIGGTVFLFRGAPAIQRS